MHYSADLQELHNLRGALKYIIKRVLGNILVLSWGPKAILWENQSNSELDTSMAELKENIN